MTNAQPTCSLAGRFGGRGTRLPAAFALWIAAATVLATLGFANEAMAQSWTPVGSMANTHYGHTATLLQNGDVLVAGGFGTSAELYNPSTRSWSSTGPMANPRGFHSATLLSTGQVLVAGGQGSTNNSIGGVELFNPSTGAWSSTGSLANARQAHTATLLSNGRVLVAGGIGSSNNVLNSAELYNPSTGTWSSTGSMVNARESHTATLLANGLVMVAGGASSATESGTSITSAELYNPSTGTWSSTGSMVDPRADFTATLLSNGQVVVAGGYGAGGLLTSGPQSTAEIYNPSTGSWSLTGSLPYSVANYTATLLPNGQVLAAGGDGTSSKLNSAAVYNPSTGAWSSTGSLNNARTQHTATLLSNGEVLAAGGFGTAAPLASAEIYGAATTPVPAVPAWAELSLGALFIVSAVRRLRTHQTPARDQSA